MKKWKINKNILLNFMFSYMPVILLLFFVQTVCVFTILRGLEKNATNVIENAVTRDVSVVEQKLAQAENVAFGVSQNVSLTPFSDAKDADEFTFVKQREFINILSSYQTGNPLIHNIVLQNNAGDFLVTPYTFYTKRINFYRTHFKNGKNDGAVLLKNSETAVDFNAKGSAVLADEPDTVVPFFLQLPINEIHTGSVAVYMKKSILFSSVLDLVEKSGGAVKIINKSNEVILEEGESAPSFEALDGSNSCYEKKRIGGEKYCIFRQSGTDLRLKYVVVLPEKYVLGDSGFYRFFSTTFNFLSILGGFLLCFIASLKKSHSYSEILNLLGIGSDGINLRTDEFKRLYPHISQAVQENKELSQSGGRNVLNILVSGAFESEEEILKELKKCKIEFSGARFGVIAIHHENKRTSSFYGENFQSFLCQAVYSVIPDVQIYFADSATTALILSFDYSDAQFYDYARACISKLECEAFLKYHIPVVFGVSEAADSFKGIKNAYCQAQEVLEYNKLIEGNNQLLYSELSEQNDSWYYPIELENSLFESVLESNFNKAKEVLDRIRDENFVNRKLSVDNIYELFGEIKASMKKITELQSEEIVIESSDESVHHFFEYAVNFFYLLCSNQESRPRSRGDKICEDIQQFINDNYHDSNLSLRSLASHYHLNPSYLCTLFKQTVDVGLAAYLENVRITKAGELLTDGKYTVSEVAERVGYNNVLTFRRSFKKLKGVNPSDYGKT